jgi:hypothetical protein
VFHLHEQRKKKNRLKGHCCFQIRKNPDYLRIYSHYLEIFRLRVSTRSLISSFAGFQRHPKIHCTAEQNGGIQNGFAYFHGHLTRTALRH